MNTKKKALIIADNEFVADALKCYVQKMSDMDFVNIKSFSYDSFRIVGRNFNEYDYIICDLFKYYGVQLRAEAIPTAKAFFNFKKRVLIYCFHFPKIRENPLVWDITSDKKLDDALVALADITEEDFLKHIKWLEDFFEEELFKVDGHD